MEGETRWPRLTKNNKRLALFRNRIDVNKISPECGQRHNKSAPIEMALGASLAVLGCLSIPSWEWTVGTNNFNDFSAFTQAEDASLGPAGVKIAGHQMSPMFVSSAIFETSLVLENWRGHDQFLRLLRRLNIRVLDSATATRDNATFGGHVTSDYLGSYVYPASTGTPSTSNVGQYKASHISPALKLTDRRYEPSPVCNANEPPRTTRATLDLVSKESVFEHNSSGKKCLQAAFKRLQGIIHGTEPVLSRATSLTALEREWLVACCHMWCFFPHILRRLQALCARNAPKSILETLQNTVTQFEEFQQLWPFTNAKAKLALQKEPCQAGADFFSPKMQSSVKCCLDLVSRNIKKSKKFLSDLEKWKENTVEKYNIQQLTSSAVEKCVYKYFQGFSSLDLESGQYQLYNLLESVLRWAPTQGKGDTLYTETLVIPESVEDCDYQFVGSDTLFDIRERMTDIHQCTTILQLLRFHWNVLSIADCLEAELVGGNEKQFFAFRSLERGATGREWNDKRFRDRVMQSNNTDARRSLLRSDSQRFNTQDVTHLVKEFRGISETFKLGFKRFLEDKALCDLLSPAFCISTDKRLQRVGLRFKWYSNEVTLASKFLNERINQFILENRKPMDADVLVGVDRFHQLGPYREKPSKTRSEEVWKYKGDSSVSNASHVVSLMDPDNARRATRLSPIHSTQAIETSDNFTPVFVTDFNTTGVLDTKNATATRSREIPQTSSLAGTENPALVGRVDVGWSTRNAPHRARAGTIERHPVPVFVTGTKSLNVTKLRRSGEAPEIPSPKRRRFSPSVKSILKDMLIRRRYKQVQRSKNPRAHNIHVAQRWALGERLRTASLSPQYSPSCSNEQSSTSSPVSEPCYSTRTTADISSTPEASCSSSRETSLPPIADSTT